MSIQVARSASVHRVLAGLIHAALISILGFTAASAQDPVVSVVATDAIAIAGGSNTALVTFARTGSTSSSLTVNYTLSGTAAKWTDYRRIPEGDMPESITIPAGSATATMTIASYGVSNGSTYATAVFTLSSNPAYTLASVTFTSLIIATSTWDGTTSGPDDAPYRVTDADGVLRIPKVGDHQLRVLSPTVLELRRVTANATDWNFVGANGVFAAPAIAEFTVTANGLNINVASVGFRRRVAYGALLDHDLRVDNCLYITLGSTIAEGAAVAVTNPGARLWPATTEYTVSASAGRYSPAIHVNQEGYVPGFPKKAMIGYYLGNLGELDIPSTSFRLVSATTGNTAFTGTLTARKDIGYSTSPLPYQKVMQADFSSFTTAGKYRLLVTGLGASLPFVIDEGVAMAFQRTYALGLYHQRCGCDNALPFSRFTHGDCHVLPAEVPSGAGYDFTWGVIASETANAKNNPRHTAPAMVSEATALYPFVNKGLIDVSGGHHDAGDYSKYTINVANLIHQLIFNADAIAGAAALDNLGLPESSDGVSDILQEAKHEADFLAKMQDADGGFYFLVYPKDRRYENSSLPDNGIQQVVWPKTTAVTAAAVAALAEMASSPRFKAAYPTEAAAFLNQAKLGWQFLVNAIANHGKNGAYQKITHYGDEFMHDDELAWAACELFLATGETQYQQKLLEWFPDPADPGTLRWSWVRLFECYGNSIRSYAFAARSGRLPQTALDPTYLAACENQIRLSGDDMLRWSTESAYGTAFPDHTKRIVNAGWYFSLDQACDMAVAYQLNPRPEYIEAIVGNMNYEAGSNPVNVSFLAGIGQKRQRNMVNQFALNDRRLLPPIGLPAGNIAGGYSWLSNYGSELNTLSFPPDVANGGGHVLQDRWADIWNVTAEFVTVQQARAQMATSFLATRTAAKALAWKPNRTLTITASGAVSVGQAVTLSFDANGLDLTGARITWEARDQQPSFNPSYTITPKSSGAQWVEVEIAWADGRRLFGTSTLSTSANILPVIEAGASSKGLSTSEDQIGSVSLSGLDADGHPLAWSVQSQGAKGTATVTASGSPVTVRYTPIANANGVDSLVVLANDGHGGTDTITVSVTISAVNDAPVATAQSATTGANIAKTIVLAGTDAEGSPLTYSVVTAPAHGTLSGTAPNLVYTPNAGYSGADNFTFRVHDGSLSSAPASVTLTIGGGSGSGGGGGGGSGRSGGGGGGGGCGQGGGMGLISVLLLQMLTARRLR